MGWLEIARPRAGSRNFDLGDDVAWFRRSRSRWPPGIPPEDCRRLDTTLSHVKRPPAGGLFALRCGRAKARVGVVCAAWRRSGALDAKGLEKRYQQIESRGRSPAPPQA